MRHKEHKETPHNPQTASLAVCAQRYGARLYTVIPYIIFGLLGLSVLLCFCTCLRARCARCALACPSTRCSPSRSPWQWQVAVYILHFLTRTLL